VASLQTESGDQAIDRLADGIALLAQVPVVLSGSNRQFAPARLENVEPQPRIITSVKLENFLLQRITPHRGERLAMQRGRTVLQQCRQVLRRAVAFV
jgi:hypothetical protein